MIWRKLLAPLSLFWWIGTSLRNFFYNIKMFPTKRFKKATIVVGNLSVGGTGKTPHTVYILEQLKKSFNVATLSRGYGRNTSGFIVANYDSNAQQIGDEPMLFFNRFRNRIIVSVGENRVEAIKELLNRFRLDAIVLDDAYQHRSLQAGMYILLTEYKKLYSRDYILPMGNLRESRRGANRAKIIIVTKCPENIESQEKEKIKNELKPTPHQSVFFSTLRYGKILFNHYQNIVIDKVQDNHVLLVTGIADSSYFKQYTETKFKDVKHINYPDHYKFKPSDIKDIEGAYNSMEFPKIILTTEKDYMRLRREHRILRNLYYLPISVEIDREEEFNNLIISYVQKNSRSSEVY